jgi:hypothetical protein
VLKEYGYKGEKVNAGDKALVETLAPAAADASGATDKSKTKRKRAGAQQYGNCRALGHTKRTCNSPAMDFNVLVESCWADINLF